MRRMYSKNQLEEQSIELLGSGKVPSVKADEIIENMSGYTASISDADHTNLNVENIFTGVVKNGNKLTCVSFVKIRRTGTISSDCRITQMLIPADIGAKLFPITITGVKILDSKQIVAFKNYQSQIVLNYLLEKTGSENNPVLNFWLVGGAPLNDLTVDTDYYVRFETTFLLSDNLIS